MNESQLLIRFGLKIRMLRNARGLSQQELSEKSGLHRTYISMVERGEKNVTLISLNKLATGLNLPLEDLVKNL